MRDYTGYRVSIVGGCQVAGLGAWIERLLPGASVAAWHVGANVDSTIETILSSIPGSDLIITQIIDGFEGGRLDAAVLRRYCERLVFVPTFVFSGFHPDLIGPEYDGDRYLPSPAGNCHSALVIAAYLHGVPQHRVAPLFNPIVYDVAGYFDVFEDARFAMIKIFMECGYDVSAAFDEWTLDGPFMYTDNHPHIRVLGTLARLVLDRAGLAWSAPAHEPADSLGAYSLHWPIHRPIARRLGVAPYRYFRPALSDARMESPREISLEEFIAGCYATYAELAGRQFSLHARIVRAQSALTFVLA